MAARIDFFISYTGRDLPWAEWVDARLRDPGYSTIVQFADFRPGQNIIHRMQTALATANQVIGILSPRYLESPFTTAEWTAAVRDDPLGEKRRLLLVRVEPTELIVLLPNIIHIDLVGLSEAEAAEKLRAASRPRSRGPPPTPRAVQYRPNLRRSRRAFPGYGTSRSGASPSLPAAVNSSPASGAALMGRPRRR